MLVFFTTPFASTSRAQDETDDDEMVEGEESASLEEVNKQIEELRKRTHDDVEANKLTAKEGASFDRELAQLQKNKERLSKGRRLAPSTLSGLKARLNKIEKDVAKKEKLHRPKS